jgi:uncharacterized membrane protein
LGGQEIMAYARGLLYLFVAVSWDNLIASLFAFENCRMRKNWPNEWPFLLFIIETFSTKYDTNVPS